MNAHLGHHYITDSSDESHHASPAWVKQQNMADEFNKQQVLMNRELDGFLDFKIFTRLSILELKLIIFPKIPSAKTMNLQRQLESPQIRK